MFEHKGQYFKKEYFCYIKYSKLEAHISANIRQHL